MVWGVTIRRFKARWRGLAAFGRVSDDGLASMIGGYPGCGADCDLLGFIDEVRVSSTDRSAAWIAAQYSSQNGTFNSYCAEAQ